MVIKRKKVCPKCGRKLWLRDFYRLANGSIYPRCKECTREDKREAYLRTKKVPDRIYMGEDGRLMDHRGVRTSIYWSSYMLETLKRLYPTTKNEDLAVILNVSSRTLIRKARELGIHKDADWQRETSRNHARLAIFQNKIRRNSGMIKKGERRSPGTEFQKRVFWHTGAEG